MTTDNQDITIKMSDGQHREIKNSINECVDAIENIITGKVSQMIVLSDDVTKIVKYEGDGNGVRVMFRDDTSLIVMSELSDDDYGQILYVSVRHNEINNTYDIYRLTKVLKELFIRSYGYM